MGAASRWTNATISQLNNTPAQVTSHSPFHSCSFNLLTRHTFTLSLSSNSAKPHAFTAAASAVPAWFDLHAAAAAAARGGGGGGATAASWVARHGHGSPSHYWAPLHPHGPSVGATKPSYITAVSYVPDSASPLPLAPPVMATPPWLVQYSAIGDWLMHLHCQYKSQSPVT